MARKSIAVLSAAAMSCTIAAAVPHPARAAGQSAALPAVQFAHPVRVDVQRNAAEPDITIGNDGRYYVSAPWGVTTNTSFVWRSEDGGDSFRQLQGAPGNQNPYNYRAGGDTEIQAFPPAGPLAPGESATTPSRLYFVNQDNLDSQTCGYSADAGRSFTFTDPSQPGQGELCGGTVGADRQWLTNTRVDPTVSANNGVLSHDIQYLWYDHYLVGGNTLGRSDNGISYTLGPANQGGGNPGNAVADRRSGVVYVTTSISGGAYVAYSADGGRTLTHMDITGGSDGGCSGATGTDFSVIAIDTQGNLYLVYACQNGTSPWRVYFSQTTGFTPVNVTMDNAATRSVNVASGWTTPIPITGPGTGAAAAINYAVFPWITVGDPGRIDVAFYGTTQATGYDPSSQNAQWNTYLEQAIGGFVPIQNCPVPGQSCPPPVTVTPVSEGPTHLSSICFNGIGCTGPPGVGGNRNLLDFFEVTHDANGMADVVYNDDANSMFAAWPGGPFDMVARQVGGPSVYTAVGSLNGVTPADTGAVTDPSGDGQFPTSDTSVDSLDLLQTSAVLKDASTLEVGFSVKSLSGAVAQLPATELAGATGITYLLVWKFNNDVWFVSARVDPSGTFTYWAGRPQSDNFTGTGGPKYAIYDAGSNASAISTGSVDATKGTITVDVPTADVGSVASGARLIDATAYTLVDRAAGAGGTVTPALADQADASVAFDDTLSFPNTNVAEVPGAAGLVVIGVLGLAAAVVRRRRAPV